MKKFIAIIFGVLIFVNLQSYTITIIKEGVGKSGCGKTNLTYNKDEDEINNSSIELICKGDGFENCSLSFNPSVSFLKVDVPYLDLIDSVDKNINLNILEGEIKTKYEIDNKVWHRCVNWKGKDLFNNKIKITITSDNKCLKEQ